MRISQVEYGVIHCSATREGQDVKIEEIRKWHKARGFRDVGYHFIIYLDGTIVRGRSIDEMGAHVSGFNSKSIGICYIGGLDKDGKPKDTRTEAQKVSLLMLTDVLKVIYGKIKIKGHRDFSPDKNGNGKIDKWEFIKSCPCFDAEKEYQ